MNYELQANKYNKNILLLTLYGITLTWIANELRIFIVALDIVRKACLPAMTVLIVALISLHFIGIENKWVKYYILIMEVLAIGIFGFFVTYHAVLIYSIPFMMAAHYHERKLSWIVFLTTCIVIIITIIWGYQFGVCDMNMVAFTCYSISSYGNNGSIASFPVEFINLPKALKLILFFGVPRIGTSYVLLQMSIDLANSGLIKEKMTEKVAYEGEHDKMTGLYNKNKYLKAIKELASKEDNEQIGILYFDINNLKLINDTMSHEMGDTLICMGAKSLNYASSNNMDIYRIGGDEFVIIIHNCTIVDIKATLKVWSHALDIINESKKELKCSMACGYALGSCKDIDKLIKEADANMYENKKTLKENMKQAMD